MSTDSFEALLGAAVRPGRRGAVLPCTVARNLTEEDLAAANQGGSIAPVPIKNLRNSHHQIARLIAQGEKGMVISEITGYSQARISILKSDPQFAELVSFYESLEGEAHSLSRADFHQRLADVGFDSIELLHERIVDDPDSITTAELLKIVEASADRTGHGKTSTVNTNNATVVLTAEELANIRANAAPRETNPAATPNRESLLRLAVRATDPHSADETVSWIEGEGSCIREEDCERPGEDGTTPGPVPSMDSVP